MTGRLAPGFTEVFGSPCSGDFAVEVKSIVPAVGSGVPERLRRGGVAASDHAFRAAQRLNRAWPPPTQRGVSGGMTDLALEPPSCGAHFLSVPAGVGGKLWHLLLGKIAGPGARAGAAQRSRRRWPSHSRPTAEAGTEGRAGATSAAELCQASRSPAAWWRRLGCYQFGARGG